MSEPLAGKRILLGVSGSIAAYKAAEIASRLVADGADVTAAMTCSAAELLGPPTLRAITGNPVMLHVMDEPRARRIAHIDVAQSCDLALVAPATANTLARMAGGLADDILTTLLLACPAPVIAAPAMNTVMWEHPATRANIQTLAARGVRIVGPGAGRLACGDTGAGRLADTAEILDAVRTLLLPRRDLQSVRLLLTVGATREPIDPVRFISNRSSGKMGWAIAAAALDRGASVTAVQGIVSVPPPPGVHIEQVETTAQMLQAASAGFAACDLLIAAAAPADYAPETAARQKLKKEPATLDLRLIPTPDILTTLSKSRSRQVIVGFAAETERMREHAQRKLKAKGLDLIAANDVSRADSGFGSEDNAVTLLWPDGRCEELPLMSKRQAAERLLDAVLPLLAARRSTPSDG